MLKRNLIKVAASVATIAILGAIPKGTTAENVYAKSTVVETEEATEEASEPLVTAEGVYEMAAEVDYVRGEQVNFRSYDGNTWIIYGNDANLQEGNRVILVMDNNGTETIYDDGIIEVNFNWAKGN